MAALCPGINEIRAVIARAYNYFFAAASAALFSSRRVAASMFDML
jgi:hypothetical protein